MAHANPPPSVSIGQHRDPTQVAVGAFVTVRRGNNNWFCGKVVEKNRIPGKYNFPVWELKLEIAQFFYNGMAHKKYVGTVHTINCEGKTDIYLWTNPGGSVDAVKSRINDRPGVDKDRVAEFKRKLEEAAERRHAARKAYAAHRGILQEARSELHMALALLGVNEAVTLPEFKLVRRRVMFEFHPDREQVFIQQGKGTAEEFRAVSNKYTSALSFVEHFMENRG